MQAAKALSRNFGTMTGTDILSYFLCFSFHLYIKHNKCLLFSLFSNSKWLEPSISVQFPRRKYLHEQIMQDYFL